MIIDTVAYTCISVGSPFRNGARYGRLALGAGTHTRHHIGLVGPLLIPVYRRETFNIVMQESYTSRRVQLEHAAVSKETNKINPSFYRASAKANSPRETRLV